MEEKLQAIGFTEKETKIYLALLELGSATVIGIGKKANVNRGTTYDILKSLTDKGLVSYFIKNKKRYFNAENPQRLLGFLDNQKMALKEEEIKIETKKIEFNKILSELESIYNFPKDKPKVRFFEGKEGIKAIYNELLHEKEVLAYSSFFHIYSTFTWFREYVRKQLNRGIIAKDIFEKSPETEEYKKLYQSPKQEMRFFPPDIKIKTDNIIFGNKVAFISYGKDFHGLVIESIEISNTQRQVFNTLWQISQTK